MVTGNVRAITSVVRLVQSLFLMGGQGGRNLAMEGLRGYAVLLVFFVHAGAVLLTNFRQVPLEKLAPIPLTESASQLSGLDVALVFVQNSHHGVDLFFLLSGYLIARIVSKSRGSFSYGTFLWKRLLRIYPAFFLALLINCYFSMWYHNWVTFEWIEMVKNLAFLYGCPSVTTTPYNYVTWSLFYEVFFYLIFPALFLMLSRARDDKSAWQAPGAALLLCAVLFVCSWLPRFPSFFFGAVLGLYSEDALRRAARAMPTAVVLGIFVGVVTYFTAYEPNRRFFFLLFGFTSSLLFVKTCFDGGLLNGFFSLAPLRLLGNLSYSFYLIHTLAITIVTQNLPPAILKLSGATFAATFLGVCFSVSLAMSMVLFVVAERWYFWYAHRERKPVPSEFREDHPTILATTLHKAA